MDLLRYVFFLIFQVQGPDVFSFFLSRSSRPALPDSLLGLGTSENKKSLFPSTLTINFRMKALVSPPPPPFSDETVPPSLCFKDLLILFLKPCAYLFPSQTARTFAVKEEGRTLFSKACFFFGIPSGFRGGILTHILSNHSHSRACAELVFAFLSH